MSYQFFELEEFTCKCGCGLNTMSEDTLSRLDRARLIASIPFVINRGCSCTSHNAFVGGSDTSSHIGDKGVEACAVDIKCTTSRERAIIIKALVEVGFTRIGIAKTFIHADTDQNKTPNVFWVY